MTGYAGIPYEIGDRVELHPGTDLWMFGARYGEVIGTRSTPNDRVRVLLAQCLDNRPNKLFTCSEDTLRKIV